VPSRELIGALKSAALRGVDVNIILPFKNNLPYVKWATENMLWELLERGVKFFYQPPPFVHSKLFLIDEHYAQIGSANIDARSLRLNFELVVEVYDKAFAKDLADHFFSVRDNSTPITLQQVDSRSFAVHLRDSLCWLFSPYL
jgi:cardiolipin synthase